MGAAPPRTLSAARGLATSLPEVSTPDRPQRSHVLPALRGACSTRAPGCAHLGIQKRCSAASARPCRRARAPRARMPCQHAACEHTARARQVDPIRRARAEPRAGPLEWGRQLRGDLRQMQTAFSGTLMADADVRRPALLASDTPSKATWKAQVYSTFKENKRQKDLWCEQNLLCRGWPGARGPRRRRSPRARGAERARACAYLGLGFAPRPACSP